MRPPLATIAYASAVISLVALGTWWWQDADPRPGQLVLQSRPASVGELSAMERLRRYFNEQSGTVRVLTSAHVRQEQARLDPLLLEPGPENAVTAGVGLTSGAYEVHAGCSGESGELFLDLLDEGSGEVLWSLQLPCTRADGVLPHPVLAPDDRFTTATLRMYVQSPERVVAGWMVTGRAAEPPNDWPDRVRRILREERADVFVHDQKISFGLEESVPLDLEPGWFMLDATCVGTTALTISVGENAYPGSISFICDGRVHSLRVQLSADRVTAVTARAAAEGAGLLRWRLRPAS